MWSLLHCHLVDIATKSVVGNGNRSTEAEGRAYADEPVGMGEKGMGYYMQVCVWAVDSASGLGGEGGGEEGEKRRGEMLGEALRYGNVLGLV